MKRVLSVVLVSILLSCSFSFVSGESKPSYNIRFLGMDWWITETEFEEALFSKGFNITKDYSRPNEDYWFRFAGQPVDVYYVDGKSLPDIPRLKKNYKPNAVNGSTLHQSICKVAGYDVSSIDARFLPSYDMNRLVLGNPYRLARVQYSIDAYDLPKDITIYDAFYDLKAKLTSLYGEPTYFSDKPEGGYSGTMRLAYWVSSDGTGVSLEVYHLTYMADYIHIEYAVDDGEYVRDIHRILIKQKQQKIEDNSHNTEGL